MTQHTMYDYFLRSTDGYNDYAVLNFFGKNINKKSFLRSVENTANWFLGQGYKPGNCFTIFMPNMPQAIICFYALNKIGIIVNMVHPSVPSLVLEEYMAKTKSKGILIFDKLYFKHKTVLEQHNFDIVICNLSQYMPWYLKPILKLKEEKTDCLNFLDVVNYRGKFEMPIVDKNATAVYIHSSGTTGDPKTVKISNTVFNNLAETNLILFEGIGNNYENIKNKHCSISVVPLFHSYGIGYVIHSHICRSVKLIMLPRPEVKSVCKALNKNRVINFFGFYELFKKIMFEKSFNYKSLAHIRSCGFGGDIIDYKVIEEFNNFMAKSGSSAKVCEGYGLSETCSATAINTNINYRLGSVGKPLPNVKVEIWDDTNKPLNPKEVGEIAVTGNTVMQGYFPSHPGEMPCFISINGEEWLRTGDMGYLDEEGFLFFVSRKKRIAKISGFNVFLQEIERVVQGIEYVVESYACETQENGKPLVELFVVLKDGKEQVDETKLEIKDYLSERMEKYSVPREINFIEKLPRTAMGKVDHQKIRNI